MAQRDFYIDRLRSVMTALVLFHHAAITYGSAGGWFWREIDNPSTTSSTLLTLFCATNQAYFMGLFFLLAGYYTPGSLEKKGYRKFFLDRMLRLGIPLLAFIVILGPMTAGIVSAAQGRGFWPTIEYLWAHQRIINGPLWFAEALLLFSLAYMGWAWMQRAKPHQPSRQPKPLPPQRAWTLAALGTAAGAILIRQFCPVGVNVFGLQLGYFAAYVFLFALGVSAWRHDWLRQLDWEHARPWLVRACIAWPCLPIGIVIARAVSVSAKPNFSSGISWPSVLYALWEPFVAWGFMAAWLLLFREHVNSTSHAWGWLNRRAYAVYILHPPVLVSIALWLRPWSEPPLAKFVVVGLLTCIATWLVADPFVRIPGIRAIV